MSQLCNPLRLPAPLTRSSYSLLLLTPLTRSDCAFKLNLIPHKQGPRRHSRPWLASHYFFLPSPALSNCHFQSVPSVFLTWRQLTLLHFLSFFWRCKHNTLHFYIFMPYFFNHSGCKWLLPAFPLYNHSLLTPSHCPTEWHIHSIATPRIHAFIMLITLISISTIHLLHSHCPLQPFTRAYRRLSTTLCLLLSKVIDYRQNTYFAIRHPPQLYTSFWYP